MHRGRARVAFGSRDRPHRGRIDRSRTPTHRENLQLPNHEAVLHVDERVDAAAVRRNERMRNSRQVPQLQLLLLRAYRPVGPLQAAESRHRGAQRKLVLLLLIREAFAGRACR